MAGGPRTDSEATVGPSLVQGGLVYPLHRRVTLLGRLDPASGNMPDVDLSPLGLGKAASRRHARIERRGSAFYVTDLNSRIGTSLNGTPLPPEEPREIGEGDTLTIGTVTFVMAPRPWPPGVVAEWNASGGGTSTIVTSFGGALIATQLPHALAEGQLELHYQPQIDFATQSVCSVEALMRWLHPEEGRVSPGRFIPPAEASGFIRHLTTFALQKGARQAAEWQEAGIRIGVSVNISARDLEDEGSFIERAVSAVEEGGAAPQDLLLEITESVVMDDPERALNTITGLREAGFRLGIDDFGTGQSSLNYLSRLPVNEVKLDRAFSMELTERDETIVQAAIAIGHDFGMEVVAEGVETEDTAHRLAEMGCDKGQGWHFGRPAPADELALPRTV